MTLSSFKTPRRAISRQSFNHLGIVLLAFAALFSAGVRQADAAQPSPVIRTVGSSNGMAPFTVHAHALDSTLGAGNALTARYQWDFGDSGSAYNKLEGFNAAHVYESPGTYTLKLTITNQSGEQATRTTTINVSADTRRKIYVSLAGNDSNSGSSSSLPVRTLARAQAMLDHNTSVLLRRDDVFLTSGSFNISYNNVLLGTYGSGNRPKIKWTGSLGYNSILSTDLGTETCTVRDIVFTSSYNVGVTHDVVNAVRPGGTRFSAIGCRFVDVTMGLNTNQAPTGVLTLNCSAGVLGAYYAWTQGTDHVHLGNVVDGSHYEHVFRLGGADRVLIHDNDLTNQPKRTIWAMHGRYVTISGNRMTNGRCSVGPNESSGPTSSAYQWAVIENNHLVIPGIGGNAPVEVLAGASHVIIRNNFIEPDWLPAIAVNGDDHANGMSCQDIRIINNTARTYADSSRFIEMGPNNDEVIVANNLFIAPNLITGQGRAANIYVNDENLASFSLIRRNVWATPVAFNWIPDGYHYVWPYWSHGDGYKNTQEWDAYNVVSDEAYARLSINGSYAPPAGSVAQTHARSIAGVMTDYWGNARPSSGAWTAGCVELNTTDDGGDDDDPVPGDVNGDGVVNSSDIVIVLSNWGACTGCSSDLNDDGLVNLFDLLELNSHW